MNEHGILDVEEVIHQLFSASVECQYIGDRATAWGLKQDLYQIKWLLEDYLKKCPTFPNEDQWIKKQEQNRILKILKD